MGKLSKVLGVLFIALAIVCFGMYFLYRNKTSDHKVVFDSDGGSIVAEQIIKAGGKAVKPDDPTKEKNDFVEWQLDGKTYNFDNVVESDITLKAIWNAYNTFSVKVTLDDKEYTLDAREGQPLNIDSLNLPAKEGYEIKLYDESGKEYDKTTNVTADLTLTAKYKLIETYTVKYDSNGGSKVSDVKVNEGETLTMRRRRCSAGRLIRL